MQATGVPLPEDEGANCCGCTYKLATAPALTKKVGIVSIVLHIVGFLIGHVPFFIVNFSGPQRCLDETCADAHGGRRRLSHDSYGGWQNSLCYDRVECRAFQWPDPGSGQDDWDNSNELHRQACTCASQAECMSDASIVSSCTPVNAFLAFVAVPTVVIWLLGLIAALLIIPNACGSCDVTCVSCAVVTLAIIAAVLHGIIGLVEATMFWATGLSGNSDWIAGLLLLKNLMCLITEIVCATVACGVKNATTTRLPRVAMRSSSRSRCSRCSR